MNKTWYALVLPFLYEHIILGRSKALQPLLDGMNRSAETIDGEPSRPIGKWTQRLDVSMRDRPNSDSQVEMDALASILAHFSNLRILTFSITGHGYEQRLPPNVLLSLKCRNSLKIVHWYTPYLPSMSALSAFLEEHPHLESTNTNKIINPSISRIRLNSLKIIHVPGIAFNTGESHAPMSDIWTLDLPAIRYATFGLSFIGYNALLSTSFFSNIGPQLQVIQIYPPSSDHKEIYQGILTKCHALQQVHLVFETWETLCELTPTFAPTVHTLAFRILRDQLSEKKVYSLFNNYFCDLKSQNPNLQTVQLYSEMNVRVLQKHPNAWDYGLWYMKKLGLSLLDNKGDILKS